MNYSSEMVKIRQWAKIAFEANGMPYIRLGFEWNKRFTQRIADAWFRKKKLRFSYKIWPFLTEDQKREVVIHEACHIIISSLSAKRSKKYSAHGREWKAAMRRSGIEPSRTMVVELPESFDQGRKPYEADCGCGTHRISQCKADRIKTGNAIYRCVKCKKALSNLRVVGRDK